MESNIGCLGLIKFGLIKFRFIKFGVVKTMGLCLAVLFLLLGIFSACDSRDSLEEVQVRDHFRNVYVVFVYSFYDTTGDGVGDLQGVIRQLDYISCPEVGLGADAIWMLPIHPAVSYHGYDVTDFMAINPLFGTLEDFDELIAAANERGVSIILDLVINHTSDRHPWFMNARYEIRHETERHYFYFYNIVQGRPPGSSWYSLMRGYYYEGFFWSGMPDLNFNNPDVKAEIEEVVRFWLDRGVHGFRLDAVKHIFPTEPENHVFWAWFSDMVRAIDPNVFIVGEVWDNENVIMPYYGTGFNSLFNFRFEGQDGLVNQAIQSQNGNALVSQIVRTTALIQHFAPEDDADILVLMDSVFLSNHDTNRSGDFLETEAQRKLAAAIYLLIPGVSYIYYGEEISMTGSGRDENKRAPMLWSMEDQTGQTRGPRDMNVRPQLAEGVAEALARPDSLLNYYRAVIAAKNRHPEIARGMPGAIGSGPASVVMYEVVFDGRRVIIAHNFSPDAVGFEVDFGDAVEIVERLNPHDIYGGGFYLDVGELVLPGYGTVIIR